jgi:hypothetical protein
LPNAPSSAAVPSAPPADYSIFQFLMFLAGTVSFTRAAAALGRSPSPVIMAGLHGRVRHQAQNENFSICRYAAVGNWKNLSFSA